MLEPSRSVGLCRRAIAYLALEDLVASELTAARDQDLVDAKKLRVIADKLRHKTGGGGLASWRTSQLASPCMRVTHLVRRLRCYVSSVFLAALPALSFGALFAGCASADTSKLRVRAAFDLSCPEDQLKLTELDSGTARLQGAGAQYGVEGCGKRATYVYSDKMTWLMNSADGAPVKSDGAPSKSDEATNKSESTPSKSDEAAGTSDSARSESDEATNKSDGTPSE